MPEPEPAAGIVPTPGPPAHAAAPHRWRALAALVVSLLVVVLDNTVLNVALKTIQEDLGATQGELIWAINAYSLVFAALLFTWGVLGDRYGRRRILMLGLVLFAIASVLSAFAQTPEQLIGARALMGIGGASVLPVTLSIITVIFPPEERGRAIGIWAAAVGGAVALGPLLGGFLLEHFWWGSVFLINVPIIVVGLAGILINVPESRNPHPGRLDPIGLVLSVLGLLALVYGIQEAGWGETSTYVWIGVGIAVLAVFLVYEARSDHPSMDLSLFRIRSFSVPLAGTSLTFAALTGTLIFLAFYYQVVRGWSPLQSGALTVPFAIGQILAAPRSGKMVARFGARRVIPFGLVLASAAMFGFTRLTLETPVWVLLVIPFVFGFGMGNVVAPSTTRMTLATPPARSGSGSAVQNTVRQVGATLGVAVISSVVATKYSGAMESALSGTALPPQLQAVAADSVGATYEVAGRLQASGQATAAQAQALRAAADAAYMPAFHLAATLGLALLVAALVIFLIWLPAQAEAVAWQVHRPGEAAAGAGAVLGDADAVHAVDAVHLVAEDPSHLAHVEEAPLEHPPLEHPPRAGGSGSAGGEAKRGPDPQG
ncbi:MAG TPA: MFS transporter [Candidatus Nanopelagicales bacterium]